VNELFFNQEFIAATQGLCYTIAKFKFFELSPVFVRMVYQPLNGPAPGARHKLSVNDYDRMGEAGILHEDDRIELIEGDLIDMAPIGSRHASTVARLERLLIRAVNDRAVIFGQNPMRLSDHSEPQPDVMVLKPRPDDYFDALPEPAEVLVLIEVADRSIDYDRKIKLPLYARHGIVEFWLIDLNTRMLERYTEAGAEGYGRHETLDSRNRINPVLLPEAIIDLNQLFRS
jgi:Uma2 family endonuclease